MQKLRSVLLVDDDPTNNFLNQRLLQHLAVADSVVVVENGREALALLQPDGNGQPPVFPTLILLDIQMPVLDGIEFLQAYQQLPLQQRQHTTVVVLSTSADARDLSRLAKLPVAGHLDKPLTPEKIARALQLHVEHQQAG